MSWTQGIQTRDDLPEKFILWAEQQYKLRFNEEARLQYITWFDDEVGRPLYLDFGTEKSIKMTPKEINYD